MSQYSRGADFERVVVKHLEKQGYLSFRCAGSKGASKVDVIALSAIGIPYHSVVEVEDPYRPLLIQCKLSGVVSEYELKQLKEAAEKFGCLPLLVSKVAGKIKFEAIQDE